MDGGLDQNFRDGPASAQKPSSHPSVRLVISQNSPPAASTRAPTLVAAVAQLLQLEHGRHHEPRSDGLQDEAHAEAQQDGHAKEPRGRGDATIVESLDQTGNEGQADGGHLVALHRLRDERVMAGVSCVHAQRTVVDVRRVLDT